MIDLVPKVEDFYIQTAKFGKGSGDVKDGAVTPGTHTVLRFDTIIENQGSHDLIIGNPADHPELFEYSRAHKHYHFSDFNYYELINGSGTIVVGHKQSFCLEDSVRTSSTDLTPNYNCANQGISAGWADVYQDYLPGQYVVLDGLTSGNYTLRVTTDHGGDFVESNDTNNVVEVNLYINLENNSVFLV